MEAAQPLQLHPTHVELLPDGVRIDGLVVRDQELRDLLYARIEAGEASDDIVARALAIGARVLDRETVSAEVDVLRHKLEQATEEVQRSLTDRADAVTKVLGEQMEDLFGPEGGAVADLLTKHADGLTEQIAETFGADRSTAVQNQVKEMVERALRDNQQQLLKLFTSADGQNPLAEFKEAVLRTMKDGRDVDREHLRALTEKIETLETGIARLGGLDAAKDELDELHAKTSIKGRTFEELAFELIEELADRRGDTADNVGDKRSERGGKKGDIVIEIDAAGGPSRGRIVLELKDEQLSRNETWAVLNEAMEERNATFAILVVASEDLIPARSDALHEYQGNKMIVALDREELDATGIDLALRYARCRALMSGEQDLQVDAAGMRQAAEEALVALKQTQKIKNHLTGASKGVDGARSVLETMVERVRVALERVEVLVAAADPAGAVEAEAAQAEAEPDSAFELDSDDEPVPGE